jgi:outer membrane protein OmpA-like peptidoglycan-associated protein
MDPRPAPLPRRLLLLALSAAWLAGCQTAPPPAPPPPAPDPKAERAAELRKAGFVQHGDEWELSLGTMLLFDLDSDTLSGSGRTALASVADSLKRLGVTRVRVEGHTDNTGPARHNVTLSRRRAEAAAQGLVRSGIADRAIERRGFGEQKPVADNKTAEGRAQNRRVVITLVVD